MPRVISYHGGDIGNALVDLFPDLNMDITKFQDQSKSFLLFFLKKKILI